jgi:hypothetical protein
MDIVTKRKVIYGNVSDYSNACGCSGFDGTGKPENSKETKTFQDWLDVKYPTWNNGSKLNKGEGYGRYPFGKQTSIAWSNYGAEFFNARKKFASTLNPAVSTPPLPNTVSETSPKGEKKKGMLWDKTKGTWIKASDWLNSHPEFKGKLTSIGGNILNNLFGGIFGSTSQQTTQEGSYGSGLPSDEPVYTETDKKSTMSTPVKIALGALTAGLLITFIVIATKNKK